MKITFYELLGMIKDGNAPKEIEYERCLLSWDNVDKDYYCEEYGNLFEYLFSEFQTTNILNFTVEILEEEKKDNFTGWKMYQDGKEVCSMDCSVEEKKIPEKLDKDGTRWISEIPVIDKINEIIDYLKSKGDK